ncbi:MAG: hypothetical protein D8H99_41250 [Streptococcus sp.]|nr:MAG: hypothetical protein D8H99_41250 [Streptococcus sp.]
MIPKYRAWDKLDKEIYEVGEIHWFRGEFDFIGDGITFKRDADEVELMQSTGLRDEFDKELFEGDVIEWSYWDEFEDSGSAKIVFDKGMFKLLDVRTGKEVWNNLFDCIENCNVYLQGNIYENPELLEDKE